MAKGGGPLAWTQMNPECNQNDISDFFIQWNGYIILYTVNWKHNAECLFELYELPCSVSRLDKYSSYLASIQKMSLQPEFSTLPSASCMDRIHLLNLPRLWKVQSETSENKRLSLLQLTAVTVLKWPCIYGSYPMHIHIIANTPSFWYGEWLALHQILLLH